MAYRKAALKVEQARIAMRMKAHVQREKENDLADARVDAMCDVLRQARRDGKKVTAKTWSVASAVGSKVKKLASR